MSTHTHGSTDSYGPVELLASEIFWRDHQEWLSQKGYMLRPRYRPGWTPSWKGKDKYYRRYEDAQTILVPHILDAVRKSDGELVVLKCVQQSVHPFERQISLFFSTEPYSSHPHNHCVPIYDVLDVPDEDGKFILVMPLLRAYSDPRLKSVGEAVEFFRQIFEGLQFMHQCHVAHRDCMDLNILQDPRPTFPKMYHPRVTRMTYDFRRLVTYHTRTARPTKYFFIDFGLSRRYNPKDGPPLEPPIRGGDKTVPEFKDSVAPVNPFPTDIYYLGNLIREDFLQVKTGVEFMEPLVNDMVQDDPSKRPTIDEVVQRFNSIQNSLPWWKLRSRLVDKKEDGFNRFIRNFRHRYRTFLHILAFRSALPTP
ncbi:hypothetical protein K474DRAFT_1686011 [Panus rudis PR-1116 ss-1]|nr:hypothetical protein K474DRAFT_1686011 [Panus rudis PR-1116 ss-1]